jgi:hypothetical protein
MNWSIRVIAWLALITSIVINNAPAQVSRLKWSCFNSGFGTSHQLNSRLFSFAGEVFVGTSSSAGSTVSSGVLSDSLVRGTLTGVGEPHDALEAIPVTFRLQQNYPNPFNPTTVIRFDMPRSAFISLRVYNVLGQEVAVLVNQVEDAGTKSVEWDALSVPSGIYICRLVTDGAVSSTKMMLLK